MDITKILIGMNIDKTVSLPLYVQLQEQLAARIKDGSLPPGSKLPPERELAAIFGISRTTAINAYSRLEQAGLVSTKVGSGTYVANVALPDAVKAPPPMPWEQLFIPHPKNPLFSLIRDLVSGPESGETISMDAGLPDPAFYPVENFKTLLADTKLAYGDLGHIPTEGYFPFRQAVTSVLAAREMDVGPENILISAGSQQGLYLITKILIEPGDYVIVESPTYLGAIQILQASGARILTLPKRDSMALDVLEDYLIRYRPKLLYTMPTFQNPSGRVMPLKERQDLLQLAAKHRLIIAEDDPYGALNYGPSLPPPLKALDHYGGVLYLGTFSKILFPGLRLGYVAGPPTVINRLAQEKQYVDLHCSNISQWLLTQYLRNFPLTAHLAQVCREYENRRDTLVSSIRRFCPEEFEFTIPDGGFYLWCRLKRNIKSYTLLQTAMKCGVSFVPGEAFYTNQLGDNEIRLCFVTNPEEKLTEGIKRLSKALQLAASMPHAAPAPSYPANKPLI